MSVLPTTRAVVSCTNLTKVYEDGTTALKNLNLSIEPGASFGLLGENGAGKSTLVRLIMGFILPTKGELSVLGERKVSRAHPRIGYLHERAFVELRFTGKNYLTYMAQLSDLWGKQCSSRVGEVLELVDLGDVGNQKLGAYSKGMLQRLCIAQALLTDPEFLILDEPTGGLDPYSQWKVRQIIDELRVRGKTLLICSHYLAEVESLCGTVGIMQRGQLIRHSTVEELIRMPDIVEITLGDDQLASDVAKNLTIDKYVQATEGNLLKIHSSDQQRVLAALVNAEVPLQALNQVSKTLEEVYIQATRPEMENDPLGNLLQTQPAKSKSVLRGK